MRYAIANTSYGLRATAGISEALVSTASGLVVAIFTLFFANSFRGLYTRQMALFQEYGGQLELLYRRRYERVAVMDQVRQVQGAKLAIATQKP